MRGLTESHKAMLLSCTVEKFALGKTKCAGSSWTNHYSRTEADHDHGAGPKNRSTHQLIRLHKKAYPVDFNTVRRCTASDSPDTRTNVHDSMQHAKNTSSTTSNLRNGDARRPAALVSLGRQNLVVLRRTQLHAQPRPSVEVVLHGHRAADALLLAHAPELLEGLRAVNGGLVDAGGLEDAVSALELM